MIVVLQTIPLTTKYYNQPRHRRWRLQQMARESYYFKTLFIKIFNWEYWPFDLVNIPVYIYWMYLSAKSRSFFFFSTSNPTIRNAGFLMESKKEIYDLIPQEYYPKTILVHPGDDVMDVQVALIEKGLSLPLVAKPDIGMKGLQVKLLKQPGDIIAYLQTSKVDFLLQDYVALEKEVGIFYYRLPGERKGHISGIVGKEFLTVVGDGVSTLEDLLKQNDRFLLQLEVLRNTYGDGLQKVLSPNELHILVPYGNHSRGAKFIDCTHLVDYELTASIDAICQSIPHFYYGRLDIKYNTWQELRAGKNIAIIEVNGAGSEPTHIYDPRHSVFFAWKEIIRHLNILYKISVVNKKRLGLTYMTTREGLAMLKANAKQVKLIS